MFNKFEWLVFSEVRKGLFCVYCALFSTSQAGGMQLKNLVTQPVTDFKHLLGKDGYLTTHVHNLYHLTAVENGKEFLKRLNTPSLQIDSQLNKKYQDEVQENRKKLISVLKCIVFLGIQNIPLRGHRDYGDLGKTLNSTVEHANDGNFRELVRFRVEAGDKVLASHLESAPGNATYTSKTVQNELINCCAEEIKNTIIERVLEAKWFSIIFDETTDNSHQSQMTFAIRCVHNGNVYEDFIEFLNPRSEKIPDNSECPYQLVKDSPLTGKILGNLTLQVMEKHSLQKTNCIGVTTDGCSTMVSEVKGAVSRVLQECPNAVQCYCHNHALNLSVSKTSKVSHVTRCIGIIKSIIAFFTASSKRNIALTETVGRQLIGLCETRWIERHESIFLFRKALSNIDDALVRVSEWNEVESASKAHSLHLSLMDPSFIITIVCLTNILSATLPLSRVFQKKYIDINLARNALADTITILENKRKNATRNFMNCLRKRRS